MPFFAGWRAALTTWAVCGIATGLFYFLYAASTFRRARQDAAMPSPRTLIDGLLLWPIMLPEAVEYILAMPAY